MSLEQRLGDVITDFGGFLRCETCGRRGVVLTAYFQAGWPTCCSYTMRWWTQRQVDAGEVPALSGEKGAG